jgi:hypothetical protein
VNIIADELRQLPLGMTGGSEQGRIWMFEGLATIL